MSKLAAEKFLDKSIINLGGSNAKTYSFIDMVQQADMFIQFIILFLVLLSLISWTIFLNRYCVFKKMNKELHEINNYLKDNHINLAIIDNNNFSLLKKLNFLGGVILSLHNKISKNYQSEEGLKLNEVNKEIELSINNLNTTFEANLFWLGTISSSAPFIGLLGTVWGIMNSFQSIALANNSSISTVAPGIAEALLATALGLAVAIPALIFNNWIYNKLGQLNDRAYNICEKLVANLN